MMYDHKSNKSCVICGKTKGEQEKLFHLCFLNQGYKIQSNPVDYFRENVEIFGLYIYLLVGQSVAYLTDGVNFMPFYILTHSFIHHTFTWEK